MLIKTNRQGLNHPVPSEITSLGMYENRRSLMKLMATGVAGAAMASWASREALAQAAVTRPGKLAGLPGV
jgi:sulfoxide reductase catalytic subunit YedY